MQGGAAGWRLEPGLGARELVREQNWREQLAEREQAQDGGPPAEAWQGRPGRQWGLRKQF